MTGAQAETWRKFTFAKTPPWAFLLGGVLLATALSERVTGYLPLTHASARKVATVRRIFLGAILFGFLLWVLSFVVAANSEGPAWGLLFLVGLGVMIAGAVGMLVGREAMGPRGKLLDQPPGQYQRLIELSNVHPAFVAAVRDLQQQRAARSRPPAQAI
jgi:hypothetical protein